MRRRTACLLLIVIAAFAAAQTGGTTASGPADERELAARITGITAAAAADGSSIELTFVSSDPRRDLLVFWGTSPLNTAENLLRAAAAVQLDAGTTRYSVHVLPGTDWWFAVLDAGLYKVGGVPLVPGENATTRGVRVPTAASPTPAAAASGRGQPLPSLQLALEVDTGRRMEAESAPEVPAERAVSPATELAIAELMRAAGPATRPILKAQVLAGTLAESDPMLRDIAAGPLASGDWAVAEKRLRDYLSIRRTPELKALARFYLGQAYWFQGRPRDAFFEFLGCEDVLPRESSAWQDACLGELSARG
jgi:hypothetical protein